MLNPSNVIFTLFLLQSLNCLVTWNTNLCRVGKLGATISCGVGVLLGNFFHSQFKVSLCIFFSFSYNFLICIISHGTSFLNYGLSDWLICSSSFMHLLTLTCAYKTPTISIQRKNAHVDFCNILLLYIYHFIERAFKNISIYN